MADDKNEDLIARIHALPLNSGGRRKYTASIKREVIAFAKARAAQGWSQKRIGRAVDINKATLCLWIGRKGTGTPRKPKRASSPIKQVVAAPSRAASSPCITLVGGHRIEGLDIEQLASLIKALS